ncbi:MAG: glycoside hydrolase family 44 protein [Chitinivibrionales bacterium]
MKPIIHPILAFFIALFAVIPAFAVTITVDAAAGRRPISPWIYGRNNSLSDDPGSPVSSANWQLYRAAGLRMLRENGGNDATKYNWSRKLTSHPDWYNNVYAHDWDYLAKSLQDSLPNAQGLLAFQLLGKAASNTNNNFNDGAYNGSAYWSGVEQNLAGGGIVNPGGGDSALKNGDPTLYLMDWPADSTTAILDHWFGGGDAGIDSSRFRYWNMDNEPEIWISTHDDVTPPTLTAEQFMQKYFAVAKAARKKYPGIKLAGFIACNEWQWYSWNNKVVTDTESGVQKSYVWAEYFIKRIGEEEKASGTRLLDVMDFHFYPSTTSDAGLTMQLHRIWFDTSWVCPIANGCKLIGGGWNENSTKEYIMARCAQWLNTYLGAGNGVTFGVSECGSMYSTDANVVAAWYASMLGTFADNGVDFFTPWEWDVGQWETLHLFSRYARSTRVQSASSMDTLVSAYASINPGNDSMTIVFVNRDQASAQTAAMTLNNFVCAAGPFSTLQLSGLPSSETFQSHRANALKSGTVAVSGNSFSLSLPKISVTAVLLTGTASSATRFSHNETVKKMSVFCNGTTLRFKSPATLEHASIALYNVRGERVRSWDKSGFSGAYFSLAGLSAGRYLVIVNNGMVKKQIVVAR